VEEEIEVPKGDKNMTTTPKKRKVRVTEQESKNNTKYQKIHNLQEVEGLSKGSRLDTNLTGWEGEGHSERGRAGRRQRWPNRPTRRRTGPTSSRRGKKKYHHLRPALSRGEQTGHYLDRAEQRDPTTGEGMQQGDRDGQVDQQEGKEDPQHHHQQGEDKEEGGNHAQRQLPEGEEPEKSQHHHGEEQGQQHHH
jgi:hypothetical protein